jgi:hypothetical protein
MPIDELEVATVFFTNECVVVLMYAERVLPVDSQAVQAIQDLHPSIYVKRAYFQRSSVSFAAMDPLGVLYF